MESAAEPQHIRPKVRPRPVAKTSQSDKDLDTLVEHTRQSLQSWTTVSSNRDDRNTTPQHTKIQSPNVSSKQTADASNAKAGPKAILRAPKYSSKAEAAKSEPTVKSPAKIIPESVLEKPRTAVKDLVVERDPVPQIAPNPEAHSIEGHTPKTTDGSPLVLSSLSDLMNAAGTLPDQQTSTPQVVEVDLSFACMTENEYEETVKYADSLNRGDVIHHGQDQVVSSDDDEESEAYSDEDDEIDDPLSRVDELEDVLPASEPRAFMKMWMALIDWITPEAVALVREWRKIDSEHSILPDWVPQVDRSDVGASRCAGLMSMLKMHISHSMDELGRSQEDKRLAETRLADFSRTLDYSRPMVKFDSRMWKAMTCVLLDMVLMDSKGTDNADVAVPPAVNAVGITPDEYRYLTRSAVTSFGASSSGT